MVGKRPPTLEHDGRDWLELKQAARFTRVKAILLEAQGREGRFDLWENDGKLHMPLGVATRIKWETGSLRGIERMTANERRENRSRNHVKVSGAIHRAHLDHQTDLPITSGRAGTDWLGQKMRD